MTDRYTWQAGRWVNKATGEPMDSPDRLGCPQVLSDIAPYRSIVSNQVVDGRAARREDLKRTGCREVDPSEAPPRVCRTRKWANRLKMDYEPLPPPPKRITSVGPIKVE